MIEFVDYNKPAKKSPYKRPKEVSMEPVIKETNSAIERLAKLHDDGKVKKWGKK